MNFILRSLIISQPEVYYKLFDTYILPIITYGSPVWSPTRKRDIVLLQSICKRFRRRVAYKFDKDLTRTRLVMSTLPERWKIVVELCFTRLLKFQAFVISFSAP